MEPANVLAATTRATAATTGTTAAAGARAAGICSRDNPKIIHIFNFKGGDFQVLQGIQQRRFVFQVILLSCGRNHTLARCHATLVRLQGVSTCSERVRCLGALHRSYTVSTSLLQRSCCRKS